MDLTQHKPLAILVTALAIAGCNSSTSVELNLKAGVCRHRCPGEL